MAVTGVASVELKKFQRAGLPANHELDNALITAAPLEILRLDNDRNFPENGLKFMLRTPESVRELLQIMQYRLTEVDGATRIDFKHTVVGPFPEEHRTPLSTGWKAMHARVKRVAEASSK